MAVSLIKFRGGAGRGDEMRVCEDKRKTAWMREKEFDSVCVCLREIEHARA